MKIYELLVTPDKWTKKTYARDINDMSCSPNDKIATKWCLSGAIRKLYYSEQYYNVKEKIIRNLPEGHSIPFFNDNATYEEVITLCKKLDI